MNFSTIKDRAYDKSQIMVEKESLEKDLIQKKKDYETICMVQAMLQETTNEIQNKLKFSISKINQKALNITFPGYSFEMEFTTKNNVSHAGIYVTNHGKRQKPYDSNGGGLGNIIAMCSQMAAKKMSLTRDVILADQPLKDMSKGSKEELAMEMLKKITKDMGLQYIMISHVDSQIDSSDHTIRVVLEDSEKYGYPISKII